MSTDLPLPQVGMLGWGEAEGQKRDIDEDKQRNLNPKAMAKDSFLASLLESPGT